MQPYIWIPATLLLCYRSWSHNSLTPAGIATAALTAVAHGIHPWPLPFVLLVVFFLAGTRVTKIKKEVKENLTMSSTGLAGGESPRTHVQVIANSGVATVLTLLHAYKLHRSESPTSCYPWGGDLLVVGIIANYAAVAADTFSSELGILSKSKPFLLPSWDWRTVPPGTNGGVTVWGLVAGFAGSFVLTTAALATLPFCVGTMDRKGFGSPGSEGYGGGPGWTLSEKRNFAFAMVVWGGLGSVLDSLLGGWFQESVIDRHTGKIIEGEGGKKVLVGSGPSSMHSKKRAEVRVKILGEVEGSGQDADTAGKEIDEQTDRMMGMDGRYDAKKKMRQASFGDGEPSRKIESGADLLDNNEVNFFMAATMSYGAMQVASRIWGVPMSSIWR